MHMATRASLGLVLVLGLGGGWVAPAHSQEVTDERVVVGLLLRPADSPLTCPGVPVLACSDEAAVISGTLFQEYYAILCAFGGDDEKGIAGMGLGIDYNGAAQSGVDVTEWHLCADGLEFPSDTWPDSRAGITLTWDNQSTCQLTVPGDPSEGVTAVAGWFRVTAYSTDRMAIIQHTKTMSAPFLKVADCNAAEYVLDPLKQAGSVGFSDGLTEKGTLPCFRRVEEETTWGRIKNTYGH